MCVGVGVTDVVTVCVSPLVCVCVGVGSRVTDVVTVHVSSLVCVCVCVCVGGVTDVVTACELPGS